MADRKNVADVFPLSPSQAGLLAEQLAAAGSARHIEQYAYLVRGEIDLVALRRAFEQVVERHEILRASVRWQKLREPVQVIRREVELPWFEADLRSAAPQTREERLRRHLADVREAGIDPRRPPPLRVSVLRWEADAAWVAVTFHHALIDGWSYAMLLDEVLAMHDAARTGQSLSLEEPPRYASYVRWLKQWSADAARTWWREHLAGAQATPLGIEAARALGPLEARFAELDGELDPALADGLLAFSRRTRITEASVSLAAWALLMARYAQSDEVVFGATTSGRPPEVRDSHRMLGMFVNTPPMRLSVPPEIAPLEWLEGVQATLLDVRAHQHVALPEVRRVAELPPGEPLYESVALHQSIPFVREGSAFGASARVERKLSFRSPGFGLALMSLRDGPRLGWVIQYDRGRVDDALAERVARHWEELLGRLIDPAARRLGDLQPLPAVESLELLELGRGEDAPPTRGLVHHWVAERAREAPESLAIQHGEEKLSYGELIARANTVAAFLRAEGVGPEVVVALRSDRSPDYLVTALAVLQAGGAFLPIDLGQPAERVRAMIVDAAPLLVVTASPDDMALDLGGARVVAFEDLRALEPVSAPVQVDVSPEQVAYVIYTSGSTGTPKGVAVLHGGFANTVAWRLRVTGLGPDDRGSQLVGTSFDASVIESWELLASGASLHIVDDALRGDAVRLARWFGARQITSAHIVPALLRQMVELAGDSLTDVRLMAAGGEQMRWEGFFDLPFSLFNQYGPTECSITALHAVVDPAARAETIPLGGPIDGTHAHVLDAALRPLPRGVVGELYLGGRGVSRGYRRRPALTAARFVPDPFDAEPGARMYRTGDLARMRATGELEFAGRTDEQVKVRGHRVELGEIEAALQRVEGVEEAAVVLHTDARGVAQLVGYLVAEIEAEHAREALERTLPHYMVPTHIVPLAVLPRTRFGKIDRRALAPPDFSAPRRPFVEATDPVEAAIAEVFAAVLGVATVGRDDGFFELGGDSILAMQVVWRTQQAGWEVSVAEVFAHPRVCDLAEVAREVGEARVFEPAEGEVGLLPAQAWFHSQGFAEPSHFGQTLVVTLDVAVDPDAIGRAVGDVFDHHDALRARVSGGAQVIDAPGARVAPFEVVEGELPEVGRRLERSLDPASGRVFVSALVRGDAEALVVAAHHLVVDGVSWRVLLEDLAEAYRARSVGSAPTLARTSSIDDLERAMRAHVDSRAVAPARALFGGWARQSTVTPAPERGRFADSSVLEFELAEDLTTGLFGAASGAYHTRTDELIVACVLSAYVRWRGEPSVSVELEGHGRELPFEGLDLSRTVGWLTSIHPLRVELADADDPASWIVDTKETLRQVRYQGAEYGMLRYLGSDGGELAAGDDAAFGFNYLGRLDRMEVPGFGAAELNPFGLPVSGRNARPRALLIAAYVRGGRLRLALDHLPSASDSIEALATEIRRSFAEAVSHCTTPGVGGFTPSDFASVRLEREDLAELERAGPIETILPLTAMQEGMLFHSLSDEGSSQSYQEQFSYELLGPLDVGALRAAWQDVHDRHQPLRADYHWRVADRPIQVIRAAAEVRWRETDLQGRSPEARSYALREALDADRRDPLDLETAPVGRVHLLRESETRARMVWTAHHAMLDGWSGGILLQELREAYGARAAGRAPALERAPSYADFVEWVESRELDASRAYFEAELADVRAATPLPLERNEPGASVGHGVVELPLSADLVAAIRAMGRTHGVTAATAIYAAWAQVMAWHASAADVVFGVTTAGRPDELPGAAGLIGLCLNTLPLRVRVPADGTVEEWLTGLQTAVLTLRSHESTPLPLAQGASGVPPREPLFESLVVVENFPSRPSTGERGLSIEPASAASQMSDPIVVTADLNRSCVTLAYHRSRLDEARAATALSELRHLLGQLVGEPEAPVASLSVRGARIGRELRATRARWLERLEPLPERLDLPEVAPGPDPRAARPGSTVEVSEGAGERLEALAATLTVSEASIVAAAVGIATARFAGLREACLTEPSLGAEPLRVPADVPSFEGLVRALDGGARGDREAAPTLEEIEERLSLAAPSSPLRQLAVAYGAEARPLVGAHVSMHVTRSGPGLRVEVSGPLSESTASALADVVARVLSGALAAPGAPVARALLPGEGDRRALSEWNATGRDFGGAATLMDRFEAQVRARPEQVAVQEDGGPSLTYRELDERANGVGSALRARGVGLEARVGVCVPRSAALMVALYGALKADAAYVPLDPNLPAERLRHMVEDAGIEVVLAVESVSEVARALGAEVLNVDSCGAAAEAPQRWSTPANTAYMIFTSGSTGRPKGALNTHGAIDNRLRWGQSTYALTPEETVVQKTPFSFDVSVVQLFWPLQVGARLVLATPQGHKDPAYLLDLFERERVDVVHFVPSMLAALLESMTGPARCTPRLFVCSGEALPYELEQRFFEHFGEAQLENLYGPTEAAVEVSGWTCRRSPDPRAVPIGAPIANTSLHVVNACLELLPVGVSGELCIGGVQVGRGYLGRPRLTAERFVPDPRGAPGEPLYRTGDLARWSSRGELLYGGRLDFQVKLRGFRIELGEIERVLEEVGGVVQAIVGVRGAGGAERLVAWVRGAAEESALRARASEVLPDYMQPAAYALLESFPLTSSGKADRRALPEPAMTGSAEYEAPSTATEIALAGLWSRLLGVDRVGRGDGFFDLGGHSLLAMRLISGSRRLFGVELPLREVFEHPRLSAMASQVDQARRSALPPLVAAPRPGPLLASFAQERLWFLDRLAPGGSAYNIPTAMRLRGPLDVEALRWALSEVVSRHEVLRTQLVSVDGELTQVVSPPYEVELPVDTLDDSSGSAALSWLREQARAPFDLSEGKMLRARLLRRSPESHDLSVVMHHVASDGWSTGVFFTELSELYGSRVESRPAALPALTVQYADYASWQRSWLRGEELERQLAYWRANLADASSVLELPTDRPRPTVKGEAAGEVELALGPELGERVESVAARLGATPFMVLLAAWQVLLARHAGVTDVSVGTPIAGRRVSELEPLIGFFVNTLVLRVSLSGEPTFEEVVRRTREATVGALEHQDLPFEKLVAELDPPRDTSTTPLFQVMFVLRGAGEGGQVALSGLAAEALRPDSGVGQFDLMLFLEADEATGYRGALQYDAALFDEVTAERMNRRFVALLEQLVGSPESPVSRAVLATVDEQRTLTEWNATGRDFGGAATLMDRFEAQVRARPERIAVQEDGGPSLTYRQLDERANGVGAALRARGAAIEARVGVCVPRSAALMVALYGALKADATYVPLDPSLPAERLRHMVEDAGIEVVLAVESVSQVAAALGVEVLDVDSCRAAAEAPPRWSTPSNAAYMIFTSGSTGRPKGALNTHEAIDNRLRWHQAAFELTPGETVVQKTPFSFDVSVWELFWPLQVGARLVLATPEGHKDPAYLLDLFERERVDVVHFVPSMLAALLESMGAPARRAPRLFVCSGEALSYELEQRFFGRFGESGLENLYGPTECAVDVSGWTCRRSPDPRAVPIGAPIANTSLDVVDARFESLPVGVSGELCIGGVQVGRGYAGRPRLTAERFVPDPRGAPGDRLYRTGDLARWDSQGDLLYGGRLDFQVKLRGLRIELGEIERVLEEVEGVVQAIVAVRGAAGAERLVAWVRGAPEESALRARALEVLPDYMQPAAYAILESFPLTASGKADRRALPEPLVSGAAEYEAPSTPTEVALAELWSSLLGTERIGRSDGFFDLGGHSLLAMRLVSSARRLFGVELPLRDVFEHPSLSAMSSQVDVARRSALPPLEPAARSGPLAASFAQERLWFLDRLAPGGSAYNIPTAMRLRGPLDVEALRWALSEVVSRHEVLRTQLVSVDGVLTQVVSPPREVELSVDTLDEASEPERESEALAWLRAQGSEPFDLSEGRMLRARLLRRSAEEHDLSVVMHHVASDGWSTGVFFAELSELYAARVESRPSALPALPVQYVDYASWQRSWLQGAELERQLAYWRERLSGAASTLELPTDRPRPAVKSEAAGGAELALGAALGERVDSLATRLGATPFMVLLAAWQTLLARHAGVTDVSVGTPIAGRRVSELEPLIGFFVNTLVLRVSLSGEPTFEEVVSRAREATVGALEHQDLPFEKLVAEIDPPRDTSATPLFQVMFVLRSAGESGEPTLSGLELEPLRPASGVGKFDLTLFLEADESSGYRGVLEYDAALFDEETAQRMNRRFVSLLEHLLEAPDAPVSQPPLATEAERRALAAWNATDRDFGDAATLMDRFEAQVRARADAEAVKEDGGPSLTYRELDERANAVGAALRERGVGLESRVGVCVPRSAAMIVALYGALKADAAYVPLDPSLPAERLRHMVEDAGIEHLLVSGPASAVVRSLGAEVLDVDSCGASSTAPPRRSTPSNAAYMIFTSGSTGRPKGAVNTHGNVDNRLRCQRSMYGLTSEETVLQKTPASFDPSVLEIFLPLQVGARLVLATPDGDKDPAYLLDLFERERIDAVIFVPSMLTALLESMSGELRRAPRIFVSGGEALTYELEQRFFERFGQARLLNLYGPTECAIAVSRWACGRSSVPHAVPIGRALSNTTLDAVDARFESLPPGVSGELCIGGVQVGRGYAGRPRLTAERFMPDPRGAPGERLYRTGDLARWNAEGQLLFGGRLDYQVKLRGFRIELGEIERVLEEVEGVEQAIVGVRGAGEAERLVAWLRGAVEEAACRAHASELLPEYMQPSAYVILESFPLTPNDKADRRALPEPTIGSSAEYEEPATATEVALAELWSSLLGVERVGRGDGFFDLGGYSLLAMRLVSGSRRLFGVELALRDVFEHPRLSAMASQVDRARRSALPPLEPAQRSGPLAASFAQERLWFLDRLTPGGSAYNIPTAMRLRGPLDVAALGWALSEIVSRHEVLRTQLVSADGELVQVVAPPSPIDLEVDALEGATEAEREARAASWLQAQGGAPFDLSAGAMLRARLLRRSAEVHDLSVVMHHVASDGWSMGVFFQELSELYSARVESRPPALPELPVQYADYASWQRSWLQGEELERQLSYWRERLSDAARTLELPTDRPRPSVKGEAGGRVELVLGSATGERVDSLATRLGATPFMVLLAAWQTLLARHAGAMDVSVGTPIAGRRVSEVEPLIGFFVNTLVLRVSLSGEPSFEEVVSRTREATVGALEHQDLPFEKLVAELDPPRDTSATPLFQVMFVLRSAGESGEPTLSGLELEGLRPASGVGKFDLTLYLEADESSGYRGALQYDAALFDEETAQRMSRRFVSLLEHLLEAPDAPVSQAPLATDEERRALTAWNATGRDFGDPATLMERFEAQVRLRADAVALKEDGGVSLTYRELDERANAVGWALRERGVGLEARVGVCAPRSAAMVVAIYGALKADATYVPLDPSLPAERLRHMVEDAGIDCVLAAESTGDLARGLGARVLDVDARGASSKAPPRWSAPSNAAYMLFTSGSTGRPKGAVNTHAAIDNRVRCHQHFFELATDETLLQKTPSSFDVSVLELFWALQVGARLVLATPDGHKDPAYLRDLLERERVDVVHFVPSMLAALLESMSGPLRRAPRLFFSGGEALSYELEQRFFGRFGEARLENLYGPTECAVDVTRWTCGRSSVPRTIPIGGPLSNTSLAVVDARLESLPPGVRGELSVGGAQVGRGYAGRPRLTAERFIPDPRGAPGERLYRTGDLARWNPQGEIVYSGRLDFQVKLRGLRIELGEIERVLEEVEGVHQAIVGVRGEGGAERLVAWVRGEVEEEACRAHASELLPAYMQPSGYAILESLPLTSSGKVDRRALPAPEVVGVAGEPPRGETERIVAEFWRELLSVADVSRHDDFFGLGGHSLLAVRLLARLRDRFGDHIRLSDVFQHARLDRMAQAASAGGASAGDVVPLNEGEGAPVFAVHGLSGSVGAFMPLARALEGRARVVGLETEDTTVASLEALAALHAGRIVRTQPDGLVVLLAFSAGCFVAHAIARELEVRGRRSRLVLLDPPQFGRRRRESPSPLHAWVFELLAARGRAPDDERPVLGDVEDALTLLSEHGLVGSATERDLLRQQYSVYEHSDALLRRYRGAATKAEAAILFASEGNGRARTTDALGWEDAVAVVKTQTLAGRHHSMVLEPRGPVLECLLTA